MTMKTTRLLLFPTLLALTLCTPSVRANMPTISSGEKVLFSDDFPDNRNFWSPVAVINKTGSPATGNGTIINSEWGPSIADLKSVSSSVTIKPVPNLKNGPISVYMMVRVDDGEGIDNNRFGLSLHEPDDLRGFIQLMTRPANKGFLEYRDENGAGASTSIDSASEIFRSTSSPRAFKFTVTPSADGKGPASAEAFYEDTKTKKYVSLGSAKNAVWLKSGELPKLTLWVRNGDNGAVWFDAVIVTQAPPKR